MCLHWRGHTLSTVQVLGPHYKNFEVVELLKGLEYKSYEKGLREPGEKGIW